MGSFYLAEAAKIADFVDGVEAGTFADVETGFEVQSGHQGEVQELTSSGYKTNMLI